VSFCGIAEALFNKKVTSFMQQIREKSQGVYVSIFTNAELLIEKYCREFIIYRLDSLVFSIDGVNADFVDTFRKNGSFETVISNRQPKSSALKYIPAKFCSF
jgi:MoaA/NifB/PqqE/SkfB family radical SAM enzyme